MAEPKTLRKWSAKRAGAHITVTGENHDTGQPDKITNVTAIEPPDSSNLAEVRATDKDGTVHRLIFLR